MKYRIRTIKYGNGEIRKIENSFDDLVKNREKVNKMRENMSLEMLRDISKTSSARNRFINTACSVKMKYFLTFNSNNLAHFPKKFLKEVYDFLKEYDSKMSFIIILEIYDDNRKGFHVHALTNQFVDMSDWSMKHKDIENQYCERIRTNTIKCARYISKKIGLVKKYLPIGERVYKSHNISRIQPEYITEYVEKLEELEELKEKKQVDNIKSVTIGRKRNFKVRDKKYLQKIRQFGQNMTLKLLVIKNRWRKKKILLSFF